MIGKSAWWFRLKYAKNGSQFLVELSDDIDNSSISVFINVTNPMEEEIADIHIRFKNKDVLKTHCPINEINSIKIPDYININYSILNFEIKF